MNKKKPEIIHHYNQTKAGVDALDQLVANYTCKRMTKRWPVALFSNMIDVSAYNSYVIWTEMNPAWNFNKNFRRRLYLVELADQLINEHILRRKVLPHGPSARNLVNNIQQQNDLTGASQCSKQNTTNTPLSSNLPNKRQRCFFCQHGRNSNKYSTKCDTCKKFICKEHMVTLCINCHKNS